jgi:serine/threonine protein kinase
MQTRPPSPAPPTPTPHTHTSPQGTFGFVDLALDAATGAHVAIKFLERGPGVNRSVLREILNHRLCAAHPHIVRFQEVFLTPRHLAIVMEYAPGGDMFEYVLRHRVPGPGPTGLAEADARHFFQQLVCSVEFAHELGVANRDIKLENTLLDDTRVSTGLARLPDVKICDFGYSKNEFVDSRPKSVSGTPDYIAPEASFFFLRMGMWVAQKRDESTHPFPPSSIPLLSPSSLPPSLRSCSTTGTMARRPTSGRAA